ncbi:hypothetical protein CPAV1605_1537 [seawater metagenome]|uniref:HECT domain-containing protein n=1 Tax=seawater metagenome TaxID=1561972 RepID=A0A5E8CKL1_9ZZZZ
MQIFFKTLQESGFLMKIDKMKDQAIGCITKSNELVIRPCIESFLRNKPNIIEGINQIIYGFFEIDIRRIMKKNVKEININIKTITSKVVFEMSHAHKIIMQKVVSKVLKLLDETGDLVKFVEYFSGIPLILSDSEIYTLKTWRGQNFSEHTCFYYVDIPEAFIRRDNIETLAVQFAAVIRAAETKFGMA